MQARMPEGFVHNPVRRFRTLFIDGGAPLDFMDSSLRADVEQIRMTLMPAAEDGCALDDIFDF